MKKIAMLIIIIITSIVTSCAITGYGVEFFGLTDLVYHTGDADINYLSGVRAVDTNNVTLEVNYDASQVSFIVSGEYNIRYYATGTDQVIYSKNRKITVVVNQVILSNKLDIVYLNDFHGDLLGSTGMGLSKIGNYIETLKAHSPNVLFLTGGDMFQGTMISNYFHGEPVLKALNLLGNDAFTLGNHEFDWGLEETMKPLFAESFNTIPLLAANLYYKGTNIRPNFVEPYAVFDKGDFKVGVIGLIGYSLESSIAQSRVDPYTFGDELIEVKKYAKILRNQERCDLVLVVQHNDSQWMADNVAALTGDEYVDMMFDGHSHQAYIHTVNRQGASLKVLQTGSSGANVGHAVFERNNGIITLKTVENLNNSNTLALNTNDTVINQLISGYYSEIEPFMNTVLIPATNSVNRYALSDYIAKLMRVKTGAVIGWQNLGGTRVDIPSNSLITIAKVWEILPFDNVVKTCYLLGSTISSIYSSNNHDSIYGQFGFNADTHYLVATNDYIFDKTDNPFIHGLDVTNTGIVLRDLFIEELMLQANAGSSSFSTGTVLIQPITLILNPNQTNCFYNYRYINLF